MRKSMVLGAGLGLALAACQDTAGPDGDRLSRVEALRLTAELMASSEGAATTSLGSAAGARVGPLTAGAPVDFTHTHESTHPCPAGGQLAIAFEIDGSFDEETNSLQADLSGSHTHSSCAFPHAGLTITVTGQPAVAFTSSVGAVNGVPSQPFTFTLDGALLWETSDGRSNVCEMTLEAVTDFAAKQRTVNGSICDHTISQVTTWS